VELRDRWPVPGLDDLRDTLLHAWDRDGYHDLRHLTEVLDRVDELDAAGERFDRVPVVLAVWFHDAVYDGAPDAEERSAVWAQEALPDPPAAEVARLVRMTATHLPFPDDANGCVLSDADLAILAAGPVRYAAYAADVRREYAHVPEPDFRAGRAAVLRDLLAKPTLFHTEAARERWEAPARDNVERELGVLEG
jgi:predicted metal-dependent HD superfamily phosphohydrolase